MASAVVLWLLLLVPLLLQIPLLVYLVRRVKVADAPARTDVWSEERVESRGEATEETPGGSRATAGRRGTGAGSVRDTVTCRFCGDVNEARYRFCRGCASPIR